MLSRCSCSRLRFAVFSSGGNSNRRSSCLRSAGTCAFHYPTATSRSSSPSADFWSTTLRSGGGCSVTPRKFSADCDRGSDRPTTAGGWMRPTSGLRASGPIYTGLLTPPVRQSTSFSRPSRTRSQQSASRAKALGGENHPEPRVINTDKHPAYPPAIMRLKAEGAIEEGCQHRPAQYLNNVLEQYRLSSLRYDLSKLRAKGLAPINHKLQSKHIDNMFWQRCRSGLAWRNPFWLAAEFFSVRPAPKFSRTLVCAAYNIRNANTMELRGS